MPEITQKARRFAQLIRFLDHTDASFGSEIGFSETKVTSIRGGRTKFPEDLEEKLVQKFGIEPGSLDRPDRAPFFAWKPEGEQVNGLPATLAPQAPHAALPDLPMYVREMVNIPPRYFEQLSEKRLELLVQSLQHTAGRTTEAILNAARGSPEEAQKVTTTPTTGLASGGSGKP